MGGHVKERVGHQALVVVVAILLVAAGGPLSVILSGNSPSACDLVRALAPSMSDTPLVAPGMRDIAPSEAPDGMTTCIDGSGSRGPWIVVEVSAHRAGRLFGAALAGRPAEAFPQRPPRAIPLMATVLRERFGPGWTDAEDEPRPLPGFGYEAVVLGDSVYVLKGGTYARVSPSTDLPPEIVAALVASAIPSPVRWWNPLSWLEAALPGLPGPTFSHEPRPPSF